MLEQEILDYINDLCDHANCGKVARKAIIDKVTAVQEIMPYDVIKSRETVAIIAFNIINPLY